MRGATVIPLHKFHALIISIHAPHAGCDCMLYVIYKAISEFQSAHPMRGATFIPHHGMHASTISIHAPHAGCDCMLYVIYKAISKFQSTHPMRGATLITHNWARSCCLFQSTHPMRGATPSDCTACLICVISIHAPHAGCDLSRLTHKSARAISIHAPHAGCDPHPVRLRRGHRDFNPRTPCGVRPLPVAYWVNEGTFQSTHPMRGATRQYPHMGRLVKISIHAPHAGCDAEIEQLLREVRHFNPRTPCGVRLRFYPKK